MADVTINQLTSQAPTTSDLFPFSTAVSPSTYKASLAQIKTALAISWSDVSGKPSFATVATTGSYTDLINKPTVGKVLQIQTAVKSDAWYNTTNTNQWTDIPGISVSITTTSAANKVVIHAVINGCVRSYFSGLRLVRNTSTYLGLGSGGPTNFTAVTCGGFPYSFDGVTPGVILYVDTPGTASTYTYKVQVIVPQNTAMAVNRTTDNPAAITNTYAGASVITATEIAA
jgi:hypothetical protein